ncbi:antibiotic biosynthesis monooxygenase [Breoghania sp.]|uniref:putative quinol monooxygenase n=1 Tax=Breoghania sp. TaxID=2065378 RepID=UPI002AA85CC4|nr:antibiotic biosynthesis monooxygenase [Breoghania sp.]
MNAPSLDDVATTPTDSAATRVTIVFLVSVHAASREELVAEVSKVARISLETEDGCLAYDYYLTDGSQTDMLVRQVWASMEDYEIHNRQPYVSEMFARYEPTLIEPVRRMILKPAFEHVTL